MKFRVIVVQYDWETGIHVQTKTETVEGEDSYIGFKAAKDKGAEIWVDMEEGTPKQMFVRNEEGKNIFYTDNFQKIVTGNLKCLKKS